MVQHDNDEEFEVMVRKQKLTMRVAEDVQTSIFQEVMLLDRKISEVDNELLVTK